MIALDCAIPFTVYENDGAVAVGERQARRANGRPHDTSPDRTALR